MAKISRQVGTTNEVLSIFIQDVSVTTGAGLANVSSALVSYSFCRNNQAVVSSGTCSTSTGALGLYFASTLTQASSTSSLGWYQFCPPDALFASGRSAFLHLYGAANMAPVPIEVELTAQTNQAINPVGVSTLTIPVGVSSASIPFGTSSHSAPVGVSSASIPFGVSSVATLLGVSTLIMPVGVSSYAIPVGVSSLSIPVGVSSVSIPVGVSSTNLLYGVSSVQTTISSVTGVTGLLAESYRDNTSTGTLSQLLYEVVGHMGEVIITTTTKRINRIDHITEAATYTLDSSTNPAAITRTT